MADENAVREDVSDIHSALESAYEAAETPAEAPPDQSEPEDTEGRPRDERGRFASKAEEAEEQKVDDGGPQADAPKPEEDGEAEVAETPEPAVVAPQHWSAEDRANFEAVPAEQRKWVLKRFNEIEGGMTRRIQEVAPVKKVIDHWKPYFDKINATPDRAVHALIAAEYQLRTGTPGQRRAMFEQLAKDYGVNLTADSEMQPDFDPVVSQAVAPLQQELAQLKAQVASRAQAETQAEQTRIVQQIESFAAEKTEAGAPAHPHFEQVFDDLVLLAAAERSAGRVPDLKTLYDRAVWANPTTRQSLIDARERERVAKAQAERKAKAEAARKAGSSVTGAPVAPSGVKQSLREELEAQFR